MAFQDYTGTQKPCFQDNAKQELDSKEGRLWKFANKLMVIAQEPFVFGTIQGHLLQLNQKPPLMKPTHKCEVKVPRTQESMMTSEVRSMLFEGNIEVGPGNKGFFTYPFLIPKQNKESHVTMNLKPLNWFITCTRFKIATLKQIRQAIHPGQWSDSLDIKSAYCHIPIWKRKSLLPSLQVKRQILPI